MKMKNVQDLYPLSPMQQGMLFHCLLQEKAPVYFEQSCLNLQGSLDKEALKRAWDKVFVRHSILRTAFLWEGLEKPLQIVRAKVSLPWSELDWRHMDADQQERQLKAFLVKDREQGFQLGQAPLLRLNLIRVGEQSYHFIRSYHHLLLDGWSVSLLLGEVMTYYEAFRLGRDLDLGRPRPYRDYINWLEKQGLTQAEDYWRKLLRGFRETTPLPFVSSAAKKDKEGFEEVKAQISEEIADELRAFARRHELTISKLFQAAWGLLLSHYLQVPDVVFGATVSGRRIDLSGIESMIGLFINTLPVRIRGHHNGTVLQWLKQVMAEDSGNYEYSPLAQVQSWSDAPRGNALFESILVFENFPGTTAAADGEKEKEEQGPSLRIGNARIFENTNYPLNLAVRPAESITTMLLFKSDRFPAELMTQMLDHLRSLLIQFVRQPGASLAELSLVSSRPQ